MDPVPPGLEDLPPEVRAGIEAKPSAARRAAGILLRVLGVLLLGVVVWRVPWLDRLHLRDGTEIRGTLGAVEGENVHFTATGATERKRYSPAELAERPHGMPAAEEGVISISGRLRPGPAAVALAILAAALVVAALRWRMLLRTQGISVTPRESVELTLLGNFFNQVAPGGLVGGDVLKSIYTARGRGGGAACWVSVFVDRVVGLFGCVVLACIALLPRWNDARFHTPAVVAYGVLLGGLTVGMVVLSRRIRRALGMESWVPRVPFVGGFLAEVDQAVLAYRERKSSVVAALFLSVLIHAGWCLCNALLGDMLGLDLTLGDWFAVIPPILVVSAIPLLPGGWGLGEASYAFFLGLLGVPAAPAVAISVLGRILQAVGALPGGIVFLRHRA